MKAKTKKSACCSKSSGCCSGAKKKKNSKKGFTLIEMLVVIVIIGILAAIVIYSVAGARQKANATSAKGNITQLKDVIERVVSVEGCTEFSLATSGNALQVNCKPSGGSVTTYATIQKPNAPGNYDLTIGTNCSYTTSTNQTWTAGTVTGCASLVPNTYLLKASGFTSSGVYSCDGSGCSCSAGDCSSF